MPLAEEIRAAINRNSRENASNTPDFILAEYLLACLVAFETASMRREEWYGLHLTIMGNARLNIKDGQAHPPTPQGQNLPLDCVGIQSDSLRGKTSAIG
ncbi:MAG: hypothetical protein PHV93_04525 [Candidatus Pacebacteria bacterium]|nr:hypothetical protein [Candidatus Paceibacterota bacterium]